MEKAKNRIFQAIGMQRVDGKEHVVFRDDVSVRVFDDWAVDMRRYYAMSEACKVLKTKYPFLSGDTARLYLDGVPATRYMLDQRTWWNRDGESYLRGGLSDDQRKRNAAQPKAPSARKKGS